VEPVKILDMEDIRRGLSDMAQNGEGAQRAQAYRMLMQMESSSVTLPEPMSMEERRERAARILKAIGREEAHVVYQRAWPTAKSKIDAAPKFSLEHLPAKVRFAAQRITTLPKLYRAFPELKGPGFPTGYPVGYGKVSQARWLQQKSAQILLDRFQDEAGLNSSTPEGHGPSEEAKIPPAV